MGSKGDKLRKNTKARIKEKIRKNWDLIWQGIFRKL